MTPDPADNIDTPRPWFRPDGGDRETQAGGPPMRTKSDAPLRSVLDALALSRRDTRRVLDLAVPVVLGMSSLTLLNVVDTVMLGRLGPAPLAASGIAGVLYFAIVYAFSAMRVGVQTLTSRRFGEERFAECGEVLSNGLLLSLFIGLPLVASAPWVARLASAVFSNDPAVRDLGTIYLHYRMYGAAFMLVSSAYQGFFAGIGKTRHQMNASVLITATNILLDYLLIFGRAGFPRLGIQGAAIASTIALGLGTAYFAFVAALPSYRRVFRTIVRLRFHWARSILRLSLPVFAQGALSHSSWFAFFFVVGQIGTNELAATSVIRSIYHVPIMIAVGLGTAVAALVGQNLGAERPGRAERLAWEGARLAAYSTTLIGLLFLAFPTWVFRIYTSDPSVIAAGRLSLMYLGIVQAFAGIALVLSQGLQGAGNTRFVMLVEVVVCLGLYLPIVFFLGLRSSLGLIGAWTGEYVYWTAIALVMAMKFRRGTWKAIVV